MPAATPETGRLGEGKRSVKVLVVGATGGLGQDVAAESLSRGHQTAALARDPSRAALPELVQIVKGDVLDRFSARSAVTGCDAVIWPSGSNGAGTYAKQSRFAEPA
jgi:putative NADH-flavin reductase